ncbi:unnamed protein product [Cylicostephanus goldi]|uniref:Galactokinase n=1 Tax=Cylicostephanus goldi TaxID=71465 RepID=A0A3P6Q1B4_CYLGO|nr:unnamed protein product [Cylicostephanus goldi]
MLVSALVYRLDKLSKLYVDTCEETFVLDAFFRLQNEESTDRRAFALLSLLREHIDYHGYGVLPMATECGTEIFASPNGESVVRIANVDDEYPEYKLSLPSDWSGASPPKWHDYVLCGWKGIMEKLNCDQVGFDLMVKGTIPPSSGLSSSSSLVCAAALTTWMIHTKKTFNGLTRQDLHVDFLDYLKEELADLCAVAEHYIGTQGGGMDQAAEILGVEGGAMRIDFAPLRSRLVKLPDAARFSVLHCGVTLNKAATSHYNERVVEGRLACKLLLKNANASTKTSLLRLKDVQEALGKSLEEMVAMCDCLPVESTRDELESLLTKEMVAECLGRNVELSKFKIRSRARHVYSEALRVEQFEEACKAGDLQRMGELMNASHESCSKDYECSCKEMDELINHCRTAGAIGARLTGAGWGGCAVALIDNRTPVELGEKELFSTKPCRGITGEFL